MEVVVSPLFGENASCRVFGEGASRRGSTVHPKTHVIARRLAVHTPDLRYCEHAA